MGPEGRLVRVDDDPKTRRKPLGNNGEALGGRRRTKKKKNETKKGRLAEGRTRAQLLPPSPIRSKTPRPTSFSTPPATITKRRVGVYFALHVATCFVGEATRLRFSRRHTVFVVVQANYCIALSAGRIRGEVRPNDTGKNEKWRRIIYTCSKTAVKKTYSKTGRSIEFKRNR